MIRIVCQCGKRLRVPATLLGQHAACPGCRGVLRIVAPDAAPGSLDEGDFAYALRVAAGPRSVGDQFFLGGHAPIEVGKLPDRSIRLVGNRVSRRHCRLLRTQMGWRIEDQNSTNGLFANGRRIESQDLRPGDRLRVGEYELEFRDAAMAPTAAGSG